MQCGAVLQANSSRNLCATCESDAARIEPGGAVLDPTVTASSDLPDAALITNDDARQISAHNPTESTALDSFDDFQIEHELARGGMGIVYRARRQTEPQHRHQSATGSVHPGERCAGAIH